MRIATLTFDSTSGPDVVGGSLPDGDYALTIHANAVTIGSTAMAEDYVVQFHRYFGDVNGDRSVDAPDYSAFVAAYRTTELDLDYESTFDFNSDGRIDAPDYSALVSRYRTTLGTTVTTSIAPTSAEGSTLVTDQELTSAHIDRDRRARHRSSIDRRHAVDKVFGDDTFVKLVRTSGIYDI